jgi:hypothetical protein
VVPLDDLASAHTVVADRAHGTVVEPAEVLTVGTDDFGGSCSTIEGKAMHMRIDRSSVFGSLGRELSTARLARSLREHVDTAPTALGVVLPVPDLVAETAFARGVAPIVIVARTDVATIDRVPFGFRLVG